MAFEVDAAGHTLHTKTVRVLPCSLVRVDPLVRFHQRACTTATRNWVVGNDRKAAATGEDVIVIGGFGYSKDPVDHQFSSSWLHRVNDTLFPHHFHIPTSTSYYSPPRRHSLISRLSSLYKYYKRTSPPSASTNQDSHLSQPLPQSERGDYSDCLRHQQQH